MSATMNSDLARRIPGWGADLPRENRPAARKEATHRPGNGIDWDIADKQVPTVRINQSTEHARLTAVFGTSTPPRGLSGALRNWAYRFSEGRLRRWLMLLAADRIDVVEGVIGDLAHGRIPNVFAEMGLGAERRLRPRRVWTMGAAAALALIALVALTVFKLD